ncbi:hypothetical protein GQ53DRAFT_775564 [Thozetella sp. PMI_491]|nr:hypothetical protein GQ53DRAFT_775564 [Thozetella sp. PMI_491]
MCFLFPAKPKKTKSKGRKKRSGKNYAIKTPMASNLPTASSEIMCEYRLFKVPVAPDRMPMAPAPFRHTVQPEGDMGDPYYLDGWDASDLYLDTRRRQIQLAYGLQQVHDEASAARKKNEERLERVLLGQDDMRIPLDDVNNRLVELEKSMTRLGKGVNDVQGQLGAERGRREAKEARRRQEAERQATFDAGKEQGRKDERAALERARREEQLIAEAEGRGFQRAKSEFDAKQRAREQQQQQKQDAKTEEPRQWQDPLHDSSVDHYQDRLHHHHGCYFADDCPQCHELGLEQAHFRFPGREPSFVLPARGRDPYATFSAIPSAYGDRCAVHRGLSYFPGKPPAPWRQYRPRGPH